MYRIFLIALFLLAAHPVTVSCWEMDEFMIYTWPPQYKDGHFEEVAAKLAEMGFTSVLSSLANLEVCRKYGLRLMPDNATIEDARRLKNDKAIWGYHLVDEPLRNFPALTEQVRAFHKADPNHPAYINLISLCGDYLKEYMETVKPDILSYDYYQWWWGEHGHFTKLALHRKAALEADIPLICWLEVNANQDNQYPPFVENHIPDNAAKIRQSVFTSLAYGVKGIEWFYGVLMFDKERPVLNECGRDVAAINRDLKALGPELMRLRSVAVYHTEPLPRDTEEVPQNFWIQLAESWYPGLCMGVFKAKDKEDINDYLIVTNTNYNHEKLAVLQFTRPIGAVEWFDTASRRWKPLVIGPAVTEANRPLVRNNLYYQKGSQRTYGGVINHLDQLEKDWFGGRTGNQFTEIMLAPGNGALLRIVPNLDPKSVR
jgi:hypothetical protein